MSITAAPPQTGKQSVECEVGGKTMRFETGELAKQAGGAVLVTYGETVVLVTATANAKPKSGVSFFPLTVDYEEKMYAAGKIPGGWIKREGRPPERTTLTSRLIDRPIRPLFPDGFRNDTHVVGMCMSVDGENDPDVLAICGAGAALSLSNIPFDGPVAGVRVAYIDGEFVINPGQSVIDSSSLNLVVAGTRDSVCMVEAGAYEVSEELVLEAIEEAHENIRRIIDALDELVQKAGKPKKEYPLFKPDAALDTFFRKHLHGEVAKAMRITDKKERDLAFGEISKDVLKAKLGKGDAALKEILEDGSRDDFDTILKKVQEEELMSMIVDDGIRPDGRKTTEIRPLSASVGLLPRTHGTGLFTRGQTQILSICTLGTLAEEQSFDNVIGEVSRRYLHQYNFPPFSVGEARFMRGPGRREIGHGALAERALVPVIPDENEFPYTLRVVSEALESNGSTSMASVCGSTLALMDAGVPIRAAVGGIAMGLVAKGDKFAVLTDIQGLEDALGEMDFKVAGTRVGITALQMDIKLKGVSMEVLRQALDQARDARFTILDVIEETLPAPRAEVSPRAPRITSFTINPDRIKDVIGPGGKVINRIIAETGVKLDIESDGRVFVAAVDRTAVERAIKIIEDLTKDIEVGTVYTGPVMRLMNFGAFVEVTPGREGLLHVSQLKPYHVAKVEDAVKVGEMITFRVEEIDSMGRLNLSRKGLFTEEELAEAESKGGVRTGGGGREDRPRGEGRPPFGGNGNGREGGRDRFEGGRPERSERPEGRPERPEGRPERSEGRPEREARPERSEGRPEREARPERSEGGRGGDRFEGRPERSEGRGGDRFEGRDRSEGRGGDRFEGGRDRSEARPPRAEGGDRFEGGRDRSEARPPRSEGGDRFEGRERSEGGRARGGDRFESRPEGGRDRGDARPARSEGGERSEGGRGRGEGRDRDDRGGDRFEARPESRPAARDRYEEDRPAPRGRGRDDERPSPRERSDVRERGEVRDRPESGRGRTEGRDADRPARDRHEGGRDRDRPEGGRDRSDSGRDRSESGRDRSDSGRDRSDSGRDRSDSGRERSDSGRDRGDSGRDRSDSGRDRSDSGRGRSDAPRADRDRDDRGDRGGRSGGRGSEPASERSSRPMSSSSSRPELPPSLRTPAPAADRNESDGDSRRRTARRRPARDDNE